MKVRKGILSWIAVPLSGVQTLIQHTCHSVLIFSILRVYTIDMHVTAMVRAALLFMAFCAAACSAQFPLPTALPTSVNLAAELQGHVPNANVLTRLDQPAFNATLQGFVLSGLIQDYGKHPAIVVQPTGARNPVHTSAAPC